MQPFERERERRDRESASAKEGPAREKVRERVCELNVDARSSMRGHLEIIPRRGREK